ncbi:MAG: Na+/H+ antiporter NhaC family protein [Eubacteriales bacterium]|nr:Na+/H+ antiporter NhaC family protein [Eubacteriales bacterium]
MNKKKIFMVVLLMAVLALIIYSIAVPVNTGDTEYTSAAYSTVFALLPPVVAIGLALITKEVYSSLFAGIITGALLYSNFNAELMMNTMLFNEDGGMVYKLSDSWNVGILLFLVLLGILVALMNRAGGSAAFGTWASKHIKTRIGAQLATMALGVLIFVDDYFNCLTVGSVMRPVTDSHRVSRAKLSYIIDATAAPVCIIAPISSWAAAVTSSVPEDSGINGFTTFLRTIPYNFYALLTLIMIIFVTLKRIDYGPMRKHELNAIRGDIYTTPDRPYKDNEQTVFNHKGKVIDLVLPVIVLIASCIAGMVYTGGFFEGEDFITAFAASDASVGLVLGSFFTLIFTFFFYMLREVISFAEFMSCIPEGFKAMISPILILAMAWTLSGMTNLLGADVFVAGLVAGSASALKALLPAIIFAVGLGLAFATGTSWGTFSILIPIVINVFPNGEMMVISIAACLAGAVCGDHCSPISDTTIMASAGGQCSHVNHVATQIPYSLTVAAVSFVSFILAGFIQNVFIVLAIASVMMLTVLFVIGKVTGYEPVDKTDSE